MSENASEPNSGEGNNDKEASLDLVALKTKFDELVKQNEDLKALSEKHKNDSLYLRADFDNYRRNTLKERKDLERFGNEKLIVDFLSVLDNFERALESKVTSDNFSEFVRGIEMTAKDLKTLMAKFGVSELPSAGVAFDPMSHEALGGDYSTEIPSGHILKVFKKPYKLHEKLIRPGQVVVSKGAPQA